MLFIYHMSYKIIPVILILSLFALGCMLSGCEDASEEILIMSWNVENLFDGKDDGDEYLEYDPSRSDWDQAAYHTRLRVLTDIIRDSGADIIMLQEIEGEDVLKDMGNLLRFPYHASTEDEASAIQCGILSRFPITEVKTHSPASSIYPLNRSILQAVIDIQDERVVLFINHWKSRIGGVIETEKARVFSARLLAHQISSELVEHPRSLIICGGDLNTSVKDSPKGSSAIYEISDPDLIDGRLLVSGDPSLVAGSTLYDFWGSAEVNTGSYRYDEEWYQFDHLLCSSGLFDESGFELGTVGVYMTDALTDSAGHPDSWSRYKMRGVSDHFPLLLMLTAP